MAGWKSEIVGIADNIRREREKKIQTREIKSLERQNEEK